MLPAGIDSGSIFLPLAAIVRYKIALTSVLELCITFRRPESLWGRMPHGSK
jgi:hypothetical protein